MRKTPASLRSDPRLLWPGLPGRFAPDWVADLNGIQNWANKIGPKTAELLQKIISSRTHPEQAYRSCLGILRLEKHYSKERLETAAVRALRFGALSFKSLRNILSAGEKRQEI